MIFARVVEAQSFSAAADLLRMSKSSVSKQVSKLEDRLGARLLNRTTRRLSLTEVGQLYYDRVRSILDDIDEAERSVTALQDEPRGVLKVSAPVTFGIRHLSPAISAFMRRYPEVEVEMTANDRMVDVVEDGFDLAIRSGVLQDSSLIARKIAATHRRIAASPEYWAKHGKPRHPEALASHNCLVYTYLTDGPGVWRFNDVQGRHFTETVSGNLRVNNGDILLQAAIDGLGIVMMPCFIMANAVRDGLLETCLDEFTKDPIGIYAIYPHSRHLSAKVRSFVDFLADRFSGENPWLA